MVGRSVGRSVGEGSRGCRSSQACRVNWAYAWWEWEWEWEWESRNLRRQIDCSVPRTMLVPSVGEEHARDGFWRDLTSLPISRPADFFFLLSPKTLRPAGPTYFAAQTGAGTVAAVASTYAVLVCWLKQIGTQGTCAA